MNYDVADLKEEWRKGDEVMPDGLKHVVTSAQDEILLRSLKLSIDVENTIKYNASKNNKTIYEYVTSLLITNLQPVS
ncbi:MAG: hypothetical protein LBC71_04920 [Oscillospiraceae bacterium]|jgi:hypothetical protein|nr:hypothetical protein [Oscillospiraceae bacterium]